MKDHAPDGAGMDKEALPDWAIPPPPCPDHPNGPDHGKPCGRCGAIRRWNTEEAKAKRQDANYRQAHTRWNQLQAQARATATADTLVASDVYNQQNQLPPRFQAAAQWVANLSIINTLAQAETSAGALKFPGLQATPRTLLGRAISEVSNMDSTIGGGAGNDSILVYGDFEQFVIVNRWPATLEVIPNLFGASRRFPTGQRGFFLHARVGSDVLVDNAFRMLVA